MPAPLRSRVFVCAALLLGLPALPGAANPAAPTAPGVFMPGSAKSAFKSLINPVANSTDQHGQKLLLQNVVPGQLLKFLHWDTPAGTLPPGVTSVRSLPSDNALIVDATPEGFAKVKEIVKALDIVPRQVKIKIVFVRPTAKDVEALRPDYLSGKAAADLFALLVRRGDQVVEAPVVTTTDNVPATIQMSAQADAAHNFTMTNGFSVTPRVNGDDTITLTVQTQLGSTSSRPTQNTVRSGEMLMVRETKGANGLPERLLFVMPTLLSGKAAGEKAPVTFAGP